MLQFLSMIPYVLIAIATAKEIQSERSGAVDFLFQCRVGRSWLVINTIFSI